MKIRTDFVTNSSSASYIVEIDITAENGDGDAFELRVDPEEADNIHLDVKQDKHGVYVINENKTKEYITKAKDTQELCEFLFGAIKMDGYKVEEDQSQEEKINFACKNLTFAVSGKFSKFYDQNSLIDYVENSGGKVEDKVSEYTDFLVANNAKSASEKNKKANELGIPIITDEEFIERFGFKGEFQTQYENIFAKEVFSDTFNEYTEIIKTFAKTKDEIRSISVWNRKDGYGDSASWIPFEDNPELEALYNQYQRADSYEKKEISNQVYYYMDSSPVMAWRDNEGEEDGPRQVIWRGTEEELHHFITHFLENRRQDKKHWMAYPANIYEIDFRTGNMKEDYVLRIDQFSDFWRPERKTDSLTTANEDSETLSGFAGKQDFHSEVKIDIKNEAYYSDQIGIDDFKDKIFVLTDCTYDKEIGQFILNHRGIIKSAMSRKVEVLIFNSTNTTKHDEALKLKRGGWDIKLITESDFMKEYGIEPAMNSYSERTEEEKVFETLVNLYETQGEENPLISKVHLKYYAGFDVMSNENIQEALNKLQDKKIIVISKGLIEIIDPEALKSLMPSK